MEVLKKLISEEVVSLQVEIVSINWKKNFDKDILTIEIKAINGAVDLDLCASVSQKIEGLLDEQIDKDDYLLEVCSAGIEIELTNISEVLAHLDDYVLVILKNPQHGICEIKGLLSSSDKKNFIITTFVKSVKKIFRFTYQEIEYIRLCVKI